MDGSRKNSPVFDVEVEGSPRELQPILRDEVYRIAGEAPAQRIQAPAGAADRIGNQLRRKPLAAANSRRRERRVLTVLNGEGRAGHWGLRGIRERTKLVGGNLVT